jgi:hypothetical protein
VANEFEYAVITGAGLAGMTAALYAGRSMLRTVVLERGAPGGELLNTELIEDYPGFEHVLGWELAQKFESHARKFGAEFRTAGVTSIRRSGDMFECVCDNGEIYRAPAVIVTAGGDPIKLGVPGEIEYAGKGVSYCAICDGAFFRGEVMRYRRRQPRAKGGFPHALRLKGLPDSSSRRIPCVEDHREASPKTKMRRSWTPWSSRCTPTTRAWCITCR